MEKISAGTKIILVKDLDGKNPVGSTVTIVYVDEFGQIFADWTDGGQVTSSLGKISCIYKVRSFRRMISAIAIMT